MQEAGLRGDQVSQVRGFADQRLRNKADPFDASNRRISIIVQYIAPPAEAEEKIGEKTAPSGGEEGAAKPSSAAKDRRKDLPKRSDKK